MAGSFNTVTVLLCAGVLGAIVGVASVGTTPSTPSTRSTTTGIAETPEMIAETAVDGSRAMAVAAGFQRARSPRSGDNWRGCNDARAAGTAPIYRVEPGYSEKMDGDGDGIACEPPPT